MDGRGTLITKSNSIHGLALIQTQSKYLPFPPWPSRPPLLGPSNQLIDFFPCTLSLPDVTLEIHDRVVRILVPARPTILWREKFRPLLNEPGAEGLDHIWWGAGHGNAEASFGDAEADAVELDCEPGLDETESLQGRNDCCEESGIRQGVEEGDVGVWDADRWWEVLFPELGESQGV